MKKQLLSEINTLRQRNHIDPAVIGMFIDRIRSSMKFVRDENTLDHFCVFYLPVDAAKKKLYIVVHKKSGLWMPPGGHIDMHETPLETVKRECQEELNFVITSERIELFNLSIDPIDNPIQACKKHYSLWYLVDTGSQKFDFNTKESTDGKWVSLHEAKKIVTFPTFKDPIASLSSYLEL